METPHKRMIAVNAASYSSIGWKSPNPTVLKVVNKKYVQAIALSLLVQG